MRSFRAKILLLAVGVLLVDLMTGSPSRAATSPQISITAIHTTFGVPDTVGDYPLVAIGDPFTVDVSVDAVLSTTKATPLVLTADSGPEAGKALATVSLPAGATTATFTGAVLAKEGLQVSLKAAVDKKNSGVLPGFFVVDALHGVVATGSSTTLLSILAGGGVNKICDPTTADPVCIEMRGGAVSDQLLGEGKCDPTLGCTKSPTFTWLSTVTQISQLVVKCDKTFCKQAGVPHFGLSAQLTRDGVVFDLVDCPSSSTVGADRRPCIADARRSNTSDLIWTLNWIDDGRIVIK